jgi:hypothetical protein
MDSNETFIKFDEIYRNQLELVAPLTASFVNFVAITPLYCAIIWSKRYKTLQVRDLRMFAIS